MAYAPIKVWNRSDRFNLQLRRKRDVRYVLLIPKTERFDMTEDIQKTLGVEKPHAFLVERFSSLGVVVEYFTLFTQREKLKLGPVATDVSEKICLQKYKKLYFSRGLTFVGSRYLSKKFPEEVLFVSPEQFVSTTLF